MEISFVKEENENNMEETSVSVDYVTGYPSLAAFIASDVDQSTLIFRQFDRLAARNLLCLQGELSLLEQSQDRLDEEYKTCSDVTEAESARDWAILREKAASGTYAKERERMDLMMEIRKKTKEYGEALMLRNALVSLRAPAPRAMEAFRNHFHNISHPRPFPTLGGASISSYDDNSAGDVISVKTQTEEDRLTRFLAKYLPILFINRRTNGPLAYISETRFHIFVGILNAAVAAALLFGAVYHLYYTRSNSLKLALIAVYTVAFAIYVGLVTNARRSDVFAASAGYAAVLVVFVSGNIVPA